MEHSDRFTVGFSPQHSPLVIDISGPASVAVDVGKQSRWNTVRIKRPGGTAI
jgi:hypothetical protein